VTEVAKTVQRQNQLVLPTTESGKKFTVELGDLISRDPAAVGRSTVVIKATCEEYEKQKLVVKVSWPGHRRVSEGEFLDEAVKKARETEGQWAVNHLPRVVYTEDVNFGKDSTLETVEKLFENATFAEGKNFEYEKRKLRIIIQEELFPLKSLQNARDLGQVFADVACSKYPIHKSVDAH
jgi:hypothetical protein